MSHMHTVGGLYDEFVLFGLVVFGELLAAYYAFLVFLLLLEGIHDIKLSLSRYHHSSSSQMHVVPTAHINFFLFIYHFNVNRLLSSAHTHAQGLGFKLLIHHRGRIRRWHSHGFYWSNWSRLWLLIRRDIHWLLLQLRRRGYRYSLFFHLIDNRV